MESEQKVQNNMYVGLVTVGNEVTVVGNQVTVSWCAVWQHWLQWQQYQLW